MLYPLISLFLFFQTSVPSEGPKQDDCEICQEEFSQLNLMNVQENEADFLKAEEVIECFEKAKCMVPARLLTTVAMYYQNVKLDIPSAEKLMLRAEKSSLDGFDDWAVVLGKGEIYKAKGWIDTAKKHYLNQLEIYHEGYCQYNNELLKQLAGVYLLEEDYENELICLNKILNSDCEKNEETQKGLKRKRLTALMMLGDSSDFEEQALDLKSEYENKRDTAEVIFILTNLFDFSKEKLKDKHKALEYAQEKFSLTQNFSLATLLKQKFALEDIIAAQLLINGSESAEYFDIYSSLRDSILDLRRTEVQNEAFIQFEALETRAKNKQLLLENEIIENRNRISYFFLFFIVGFSILFVYYLYNRNSKRELRLKLEKVLARDEERNNLAKKLHDEVSTDMLLLSQKLSDENLRKNLLDLRGNIRGISHELSTEDFGEISFEDQIKNLMVDMMDLGVQLSPKGLNEQDWTTYSNAFKKMLYLLIKEAVVNAQAHGKAKNIDLVFDAGKKSMLLGIKDDGTGFDTEGKAQGIGIRNMKKRTKEVNGLLEIDSSPGNGAEFKFTLPIER